MSDDTKSDDTTIMDDFFDTTSWVGDVKDWRDLPELDEEPEPQAPATTRKLRRVEQRVMSLSTIAPMLDRATASLKDALLPLLSDVAVAPVRPSPAGASLCDLLSGTMRDLADSGAREVRHELARQGAHDLFRVDYVHAEGARIIEVVTLCAHDLEADLRHLTSAIARSLKTRTLTTAKRRAALRDLLARRLPALAGRYAARAINEGFAIGRTTEIARLRRPRGANEVHLSTSGTYLIEQVIMTAVLDRNTCEECDAVDGRVMDYGSDEQQELEPPYYKCLGGARCRCQQIAVLADGDLLTIVDGEITDDEGEVIDREEVASADEEDTIP